MKCLVLAGGQGERLWPLSRKNYPKQFIEISGNHSVFQDTIARNIPFCDEFIIVTNVRYRNIIENQMKAFRSISYRCIYEHAMRHTSASVVLATLELQPSETVFVVSSDCMVEASDSYRDAIVEARRIAGNGGIVVFGRPEQQFRDRYGYIFGIDANHKVGRYVEKPSSFDGNPEEIYRNLGMVIYRAGDFLNQVRVCAPDIYGTCREAYSRRRYNLGDIEYSEDSLRNIESVSIERSVLERTDNLYAVRADFDWEELTSLEDLEKFSFRARGLSVTSGCSNTMVINESSDIAVVVNELDDAIVVNTDDAVYVGRRGSSHEIKQIMKEHPLLNKYTENSTRYYRHWGYFIQLCDDNDYYVRHVVVLPGRTIYAHKHETRHENWIMIRGRAVVTLDNEMTEYDTHANIDICPGVIHQISNPGTDVLEFIDVSYGKRLHEEDSLPRLTGTDVDELDLGHQAEPLVLLKPVFKDYIWGGRKLIEDYKLQCDYEHAAEAWVMSAHPDGQSIVANGRHSGMFFGKYIETVGRDILGWKCAPLKDFPLLVKLIDAKENLSVQVHPDDDYAMTNEGEYGKNEMWYVISSEEGAGLYVGFRRDVTAEEVIDAVGDGSIMELMNFFPTNPGDVFFIPAGTVHAIGAGNLICEIQQSSNSTYRLYDYDRIDRFGNRRELHLDKALDVMNLGKYIRQNTLQNIAQNISGTAPDSDASREVLCRCKYFEVTGAGIPSQLQRDSSCFYAVVCLAGQAELVICDANQLISAGEVVFIPAGEGTVNIMPVSDSHGGNAADASSDDARLLICRI